jgi:hypothetical protein
VTAQANGPARKSTPLAVILNLLPLIGLVSCTTTARDFSMTSLAGFQAFWWLLLIWGLGYLYVGKPFRFLLSLLIPWISCFTSSLDFEHARYNTADLLPWLLVMTMICVITAVDAGRLAVAHNAKLDHPPEAASKPPETTGGA